MKRILTPTLTLILTLVATGSVGVLTALTSAGCGDNSAECGPGTVEESGRCVPSGGNDGGGLNCGEGTHEFNGECVDFDPNDMTAPTTTADPTGGGFVNLPTFVTLTSDEVAVIYYTTDGSEPTTASASEVSPVVITTITEDMQLKFFAVDPAGNTEAVNTETYTIDSVAPDPVLNLAASDDGTDVTLTWENPTTADLGGVMIVRSIADHVEFEPTAGVTYSVGDTVAPGEEVVFLAAGTTATDSTAAQGFNAYRAWAMDFAGNFSVGRQAYILRAIPPQLGTIEITLGAAPNATVRVISQPANVVLSGTARYLDASDQVELDLTIENQLARIMHNTKAVVTGSNVGTLSNGNDVLDGNSFVQYGNRGLAPTLSATRMLVFDGIDGNTNPIVIDFEIRSDPLIVVGTHFQAAGAVLLDAARMKTLAAIACDEWVGPRSRQTVTVVPRCAWRPGTIDPTGRYLYMGNRARPVVRVVDLTSHSTVASAELAQSGSLDNVVASPDGEYIYAIVNTTGDAFMFGNTISMGDVILVKLRAKGSLLVEVARIPLIEGVAQDARVRGRLMDITPDGGTAAIPVMNRGEVFFVDLASMSLIDTDPSMAGVQPLDVSASSMFPKLVKFTPDSQQLVVGYAARGGGGSTVDLVDMSDFASTELPTMIAGATGVGALKFDPMGRLWIARTPTTASDPGAISVYDLSGPTESTIDTKTGAAAGRYADSLALTSDKTAMLVPFRGAFPSPSPEMAIIDIATLTRRDFDSDSSNGVSNFVFQGSKPGGHWLIVTP